MSEVFMQSKNYTPRNPWTIFGVTAVGTFMATLDSSIVNVALPNITIGLGTELPLTQWVVTAYLLTITSLLPVFGRAGDMYGQRVIYATGFLVFAASSLACGLASSIYVLIASRVFQAVGASMLMANASAIVAFAFPPEQRGRALGAVGTIVAMGSLVGPSVGGVMVGLFGWESIFYINVPIGIIGFLAGRAILPYSERKHEDFDVAGAVLFALGIGTFLLVISNGEDWGWGSSWVMGGTVLAVLAIGAFIFVERRVEYPMLDLSLFQRWPFMAGNLAGLFSFMAMFSNTILMPFFLTTVLGLEPTHIGLLMTPFPLVMAVVAPISGYLSERVSPVILTTCGLTITMVGLLTLATFGVETRAWQVLAVQALMGMGNGLFQSPNNNSVISSVDRSKTGIAGGVNALVRNLGMVMGTAVAVSVFETQRRVAIAGIAAPTTAQSVSAFLQGYHTALIVGAVFAAVAAIISFNRRGYARAK
jgi:EmrB/QacA subfamily drug resistance transporter